MGGIRFRRVELSLNSSLQFCAFELQTCSTSIDPCGMWPFYRSKNGRSYRNLFQNAGANFLQRQILLSKEQGCDDVYGVLRTLSGYWTSRVLEVLRHGHRGMLFEVYKAILD